MKKRLKISSSLLICCLILLSGCGTPSTSLPSELAAQSGNYPKSVSILAPDFFKATGVANTDQAKKQWLDEMSERYGVEFNIVSSYNTDSESTFVGLVSASTEYVSTLKSDIVRDSYVPLEDYLADNPVWNGLPEDFKSLFEVDGHIYAIPTTISRVQNARIIHNEALKEAGITVTDLDSFRDFSVAYAKENGHTFKGIYFSELMDILNAFGLYPRNDIYTPFSYDPTEDCYVDFMTKDTVVEALEYLRGLYKAGAMYWGFDSDLAKIQATFDSGIFASAYDQYYDYDNCSEVLTLNSEYPQILFTNVSGFAMTQDTPQPQETINLLIDMLFGSEQNYLECWLGSSDNYTLNSDGTITIEMMQDSEGNYVYPCIPNLTGALPGIFPYSNSDIFYSQNGVIDMDSKTAAGKANTRLKLLDESLKNGSIVEIPLEYQLIKSATYDANLTGAEMNVSLLYVLYFSNAVTDSDKTVQEIIDKYKEQMLNMGGNAMLDEMNAAIGKKTAYYYG